MPSKDTPVPSLVAGDKKNELLIRQKIIDSAEGRLVSVVEEFDKAFSILSQHPQTITVFGSARLAQSHKACQQAFKLAGALAKHDYAIVTGGGRGIMQAANHGALDAGGASIGFNIHLPMEQNLNEYTTEHYTFEHFFGRKVAMTLDASAYVFCPGGFGTFDEMFEILTLVQTGIVPAVPMVLLGEDFWRPLDSYIRSTLDKKYATIAPDDTELYLITDDIDAAVTHIHESSLKQARSVMKSRAKRQEEMWSHLAVMSNNGWGGW